MTRQEKIGTVLAMIAGLIGIIGHYYIFLNWYHRGMAAEAAEPGCEILLKWVHPALTDVGLLAGAIFVISAYGFFTRSKWAFSLSVIAIVLALQGSWFINVPFMAAGLPPVYFSLFWPYLLLYFLIVRLVGKLPWPRILIGLVAGMAFVFCLMNGIASLSRIMTIGAPIFIAVQRLHWISMIGWGVVTVGILLQPKEWMRVVGLIAGLLELVVGIPLAIVTAQQLGRFSLFSLAPISCFILVVLFIWPGLWRRLIEAEDVTVQVSPSGAD